MSLRMDHFIFTVLLLSDVSSCAGLQYHFVNENMTWTEAQSYCRGNYTDLATVEDTEDMMMMVDITVQQDYKGPVWIGLYYGDTWRWSIQDNKSYSHADTGFRNWSQTPPELRQPDNGGTPITIEIKAACVMINNEGSWNDAGCSTKYPTVCYQENNAGGIYVINSTGRTWTEAQIYCRQHYTDLAIIRNSEDNQNVTSQLTGNTWIGLHRDWVWSDQNNSTYRSWTAGLPLNNKASCAVADISQGGTWMGTDCSARFPFICYQDNLVLVRENKTWKEALLYCRQNHVDLVSVASEKVQRWVREMAGEASTPYVWMGLRYSYTLNFWLWVSGEFSCYQSWSTGNGTGWYRDEGGRRVWSTGAQQAGGEQKWVSLSEDTKLNFICIK
uniref:C-type lectin domain-containing protein n=2 Tax=Denticeps clupeoides TaxID=299321 RepID=A0AAY4C1H0_9TELE